MMYVHIRGYAHNMLSPRRAYLSYHPPHRHTNISRYRGDFCLLVLLTDGKVEGTFTNPYTGMTVDCAQVGRL